MDLRLFFILFTCLIVLQTTISAAQERKRARDYGIEVGILKTGKYNAITDVQGVSVGHTTLIEGDSIRTGVTAILPHQGNMYREKVPAAVYIGNAFGKAVGLTQIEELGNIETPIALTNTLNSWIVANGIVDYMLGIPENSNVRSINPIVGETNDGALNDIRGRHVNAKHLISAIKNAEDGPVQEGNVGAGTGTSCLGFKGGIGTSSRILPDESGGYTVGVLVQTNFGGILTINGAPVGRELNRFYSPRGLTEREDDDDYDVDGSCMIIIATDAPLSARNLKRLAKRSFLAFGRVGSFSSNGSGDFSIAFSTNPDARIEGGDNSIERVTKDVKNSSMSPLFLAVLEATEEAIYNSMFKAEEMTGKGRTRYALPIKETIDILKKYNALNYNSRLNPYKK